MLWLDALEKVLEKKSTQTKVFFRDDDAPWEIDNLDKLAACFADAEIFLDVAVIPNDLDARSQKNLRSMQERYQGFVRLHQHGYAHQNHEKTGRKCEFGKERTYQEQHRDIGEGLQRMQDNFDDFDLIFTPPWNRCTEETVAVLHDLNFKALSRISGSGELDLEGLTDIPVTIDWEKKRKGVAYSESEFATYVSDAFAQSEYVGIMLHHAVMFKESIDNFSKLLKILSNHRKVSCFSMADLIRNKAD